MRLLFVRHGESEANLLHVFSNRGTKHPLTARGIDQARELARGLQGEGIAKIWASPVLRAWETARIVSEELELPGFSVDHDLREYDVGVLEGRSDQDAWDQYEALERAWDEPAQEERSHEGGESLRRLRERFLRAVERIAAAGTGGGAVLVVSHGGVLRSGLPAICDLDRDFTRDHPLDHGEVVEVAWQPGGGRCLRWGHRVPGLPNASELSD